VDLLRAIPEHSTLPGAFQASAARVPERVALRTPGGSVSLTWGDYAEAVERVAGSLAALGVGRGERVALCSRNRPELAVAEVAALHLGAGCVALYPASPTATIEHVLADSEPAVLLIESGLQARLGEVSHSVAHVLALNAGATEYPLLDAVAAPGGFDFQAAWGAVEPGDLAALIYTSGTTGVSKAVEWTHAAATGSVGSFDAALGAADGSHTLSYAPFASLAERYGGHWLSLMRGFTRTFCEDPAQLGAALLDVRPTGLGGPPQVWQRLKRALEATLTSEERVVLDRSVERVRTIVRGGPDRPLAESEEVTLAALRARLGLDRVTCAGSTAAPCPEAVHEHCHALGVPFQEFFAMTEAGVVTAQRPGLIDFGSLGRAVAGYELEIAEDGELLVRSPNAPRGYRNRPRETAETYGAEGWIHTGDLGELDGEGRLRLVGRKKEMIVPEHGVNVAPAPIESALKDACAHVAQVCVIGDKRPHLVALVVLDPPERRKDDGACAAVAAAIEQVNAGFGPRERIEAHAIVSDAWLPGELLTETLKMRRAQIAERYATTIEELYAPAGQAKDTSAGAQVA
jgi:long-chain acyl-CoA synthetase